MQHHFPILFEYLKRHLDVKTYFDVKKSNLLTNGNWLTVLRMEKNTCFVQRSLIY